MSKIYKVSLTEYLLKFSHRPSHAVLFEMLKIEKPKIALLKIHSMRSKSSKLKLGRKRQQKSVKLCNPCIDSKKSDLQNVKD